MTGDKAALGEGDQTNLDIDRPAGVFISYATEDQLLAEAIYQSLQRLGETVYDRVKVFLDSKSLLGGDPILGDIRTSLEKSDFLIILYTGVVKRSHHTGYEVGFFDALMQLEKREKDKPARKKVSLYLHEPPTVTNDTLGISIKIDPQDLSGSRADYVAKSKQDPDNPDQLAKFFLEIAKEAESRLPEQLKEEEALDKRRQRRKQIIADEIIPNLKGKFFDSLSTRITRGSVEQKLIEFDLPTPIVDLGSGVIPDDARLTQNSGSFDIFGVAYQGDSMAWKDFKNAIQSRDPLGGSSILLAIEQVLISAISPSQVLDNEQIVKSLVTNNVYHVLVTRQQDYYNGRKVVHMFFVQKLQDTTLGNADTSIILGFINIAAKYRFIFIERDSQLSVESFSIAPTNADVRNKVRRLTRELLLIEQEAHSIGLNQPSAIYTYFGSDKTKLSKVTELQGKWYESRKSLMASAEKVLGADPNSAAFSTIREEWLKTLAEFRDNSEEINSVVTTQALENLKKTFAPRE